MAFGASFPGMRFPRGLWRSPLVPQRHGAPGVLDFPAAAAELGVANRLQRKPWGFISDVRQALEQKLGLGTDGLLLELARWLEASTGAPSAAGLAHVSGNVYLAPALDLNCEQLSPAQVLVANVLSHGEIGIDAVALSCDGASAASNLGTPGLLQEVATFKRMRFVDPGKVAGPSPQQSEAASPSFAKKAKRNALRSHPLMSEALQVDATSSPGKCLQHPNFGFLEVEGNDLDEMQECLARNSAARAYSPHGEGLAGCAVRTEAGALFAGCVVAPRSLGSHVAPLASALVSLGANGGHPDDVVSVVWAGGATCEKWMIQDKALMRSVLPAAAWRDVQTNE